MKETPAISSSSYASNVMSLTDVHGWGNWGGDQTSTCVVQGWEPEQQQYEQQKLFRRISQQAQPYGSTGLLLPTQTDPNITEPMAQNQSNRRIVQVFIADPNENVPLEESVLFKGDQKLTDSTDTELFFEVPIATTLAAHNAKRVKWLDKEATKRAGKDVFLDPVKIRDLKMVVVTAATF